MRIQRARSRSPLARFRTELLTLESTKYAASSIADYAKRTQQTVTAWQGMNGKQRGDPPKLAAALVQLTAWTSHRRRRRRDRHLEDRAKLLLDQPDAHRDLSSHLDHDDA